MGVDVFKSYHSDLGILDTGMYDHDLVYGVSPGGCGSYLDATKPRVFSILSRLGGTGGGATACIDFFLYDCR